MLVNVKCEKCKGIRSATVSALIDAVFMQMTNAEWRLYTKEWSSL